MIYAADNVELLLTGRQLLEGVRPQRDGELAGFTDAVLGAAADWAADRLGKSQRDVGDAAPVPALLEVLATCKRCQGRMAELPKVLQTKPSVRRQTKPSMRRRDPCHTRACTTGEAKE